MFVLGFGAINWIILILLCVDLAIFVKLKDKILDIKKETDEKQRHIHEFIGGFE